ncbi:Flp pilus assembly protein CpaB [Comamonas terrigena]|uniref:Flp pilus assembly protein CpaB n=1 Tax=Comamonas terrigena TaxID=32013 RepID=UPI00244D35E7|nr:Flp pilus assembly protein CpaB [Comamonas terrigena]MDH0050699.1 Flp pilus assembly protein CpaB [Comamonas terrigena]MDH0513155.1 Flp pilus assembly protein CpaB [Comamonas terrigena]MDH1092517.1 Flp pilus assembly protein CpaB [Comamonas terrigena]
MHKGFKFVALALVVLGGGLAWMAFLVSGPARAPVAPTPGTVAPTVSMVVASKALPAGHLLQAEDVHLQPVAMLPPGAVALEASVLGRTLAQPAAEGDPVIASRLLGGIAAGLQAGERAVAIKVDESSAVGHKLAPGDWVDVLVVLRKDSQEVDATQARQLLARKRVLAYGSQMEGAAGKDGADEAARTGQPPRTAVLAVQAQEVNALLLAERQGQVLLALRNPLDREDAPSRAAVPSTEVVVLEQLARTAPGRALLLSQTPSLLTAHHGLPPAARRPGGEGSPPRATGLAVEVLRGNRSETVHY